VADTECSEPESFAPGPEAFLPAGEAGVAPVGADVGEVVVAVAFAGFRPVEELGAAEWAVVATTGSAAEFTRACTFVAATEEPGNTAAVARENSFCRAAESLAEDCAGEVGAADERSVGDGPDGDPTPGGLVLVEFDVRLPAAGATATGCEASRLLSTEEAKKSCAALGSVAGG
jgi:hypothetical protein